MSLFEDSKTFAPFVLMEYDHEPGTYTLLLTDDHMVMGADRVFEAHDRLGNGYAWSDVALQAMRTSQPELEAKVEMDPEAGMFAAYGPDLEALKALAGLLHTAFHDHAVLGPLVAAAPYEYD